MVRVRKFIRLLVIGVMHWIYTKVYGMDIAGSARISFRAILDKTNPKGVHIDEESYVASGAIIFTHDFARDLHAETYIGKRCFIGANAIVMAGIRIGDEVVVGAGAVVTRDVTSGCIVAGNPARVIKEGVRTKKFGQLI